MTEKSKIYESLILKHLKTVGLTPPALAMNVSETTVSRFQEEKIPQLAVFLDALGLKVVPQSVKCYSPDVIDPYIKIAKQHLAKLEGADSLEYDE